ncbi:hypothetical protein F889_01539 [Acinetobacter colistiniresistens]|uniref:Uncharacterized protein n=1 Tax=Acinetobacter colistiniresistens TaxID=280145 RepID=N9PMX1_9GAMM|nr:hypothetical protein [Acinetobacter colistiniresistens]ENX34899.1 hypothetical protein F889_01539 [Acinetobacter colistiniresistens]
MAYEIITSYNVIARSRRYVEYTPLQLDLSAINAFCEQYDLPVERWIFNECIFAIDNLFIDEAAHRQQAR